MALSVADLITCSCLLTSNMLIREAYNGYSKGEKAMVPQLKEFFATLGLIQRDAVWWVHTIVPGAFRPQPVDYKACLKKCLFLEPAEAYCSKDNWPPESDRRYVVPLSKSPWELVGVWSHSQIGMGMRLVSFCVRDCETLDSHQLFTFIHPLPPPLPHTPTHHTV